MGRVAQGEMWATAEPLVIPAGDPSVLAAVHELAPESAVELLGGTMTRNLHLVDPGLVLRIHPRFVTRTRVMAERSLKRLVLREHGMIAADPVSVRGHETFMVGGRVAELERYVEHTVSTPTWEHYRAVFATLGRLHRVWACVSITRPVMSTYGPPSTLRRRLALLRGRVAEPEAKEQVAYVTSLVGALGKLWVPARLLPRLVVHGDARLGNLAIGPAGEAVVLDLGFSAVRPRLHDLAYALAWILLRPDDSGPTWPIDPDEARRCLAAYEESSGQPLSGVERQAFDGYLAGTCLYLTAIAAHVPDPDLLVLEQGNRRMVDIADHILSRPRLFT